MKRHAEESVPFEQIGRCPVGGCQERHATAERLARIETKVWIVMAGVGAVIMELGILLYRGGVSI